MAEGFLVGTFGNPEMVVAAVSSLRRERFRVYDVFAPYPVHGLDEAIGIRGTRLPFVTLVAGLTGLTLALLLQFYANVFDWPLNVGGKPSNSALAFIPICFELTVLLGGLATVFALFVRARLYPGKRERLAAPGVTDDTFALVVRRPLDYFDARRAREILEQHGADVVDEREEQP